MSIYENPEISVLSVDYNSFTGSREDEFPITPVTPVTSDGFPLTGV